MLMQADTGIDWDTIVAGHDDDSLTNAEVMNMCVRASELCDLECNQVLRATIDTEQLDAPSDRCAVLPGRGGYLGRARAIMSRWPVRQVLSINVAPAEAFPWTFTPVTAGHWGIRNDTVDTLSGAGAYMVEFEAAWVDWVYGREGYVVQIEFVNGWANALLTAPAGVPPVSTLTLDDITGTYTNSVGAQLTIYDGAQTETVTVTAATPASGTLITGPGSVTLASACQYEHQSGVLVSALPSVAQQGAIYFGADLALTRGATSIGIDVMKGGQLGETRQRTQSFLDDARRCLNGFKRII